MKSFLDFLKEAPSHLSTYGNEFRLDDDDRDYSHPAQLNSRLYQPRSDLKGHEVWIDRNEGLIQVVHPKTHHTMLQIKGKFHGYNEFTVNTLAGHRTSPIKAHELYHHLVHEHGLVLNSSDRHSTGGMKTWKRLTDKSDIEMKHFSKGKIPLKMHKGEDFFHNYVSPLKGPLVRQDPLKRNSYFQATKKRKE